MSTRVTAAVRVWRSRSARTRADHAYAAYLGLLVALVAVVPLVRAAWLGLTGPQATLALTSGEAPGATVAIVAGLWGGALLGGPKRGPALRAPFLTHALASAELARADVFRGPVLRAGVVVATLTTASAAMVGLAVAASHGTGMLDVTVFVVAGALVGVIATILWLIGQVFPRAALPGAAAVVALGAATTATPGLRPFTPWGWAGLAFPAGDALSALAALVALSALATALSTTVPMLLDRLELTELLAQSLRWDSATVRATGMDFGAAAAVYRTPPRFGRRLRAVRPHRWSAVVVLRSDAIGAVRTPGRLLLGVVAVAGAGVLGAFAVGASGQQWAWGAAAGVLLFAGLGPLTDGIRHAVAAAADLPLYGMSDERLLAGHALFPVSVSTAVLLVVAVVCAAATGSTVWPPVLGVLLLGLFGVLTGLATALQGPLPPALLAPMPTPMGDLGGAVRFAWALQGVLLAGLAGAATAMIVDVPGFALGTAVVLIGLCAHRWRHRH
ncbi:hypothetical protein [Microbacterium sufflavum]